MRKAESAIKFKRPGRAFAGDLAARPRLLALPGALPFAGGVPLTCKGEIVGSIGIGGIVSNRDAIVAQAGADALE